MNGAGRGTQRGWASCAELSPAQEPAGRAAAAITVSHGKGEGAGWAGGGGSSPSFLAVSMTLLVSL